MIASAENILVRLAEDGYVLLPTVFTPEQAEEMARDLTAALTSAANEGLIQSQDGTLYAARNLVAIWPATATVWQKAPLTDALFAILGSDFGLVRALYFDKPPQQSWTLPWHKDMTIAVRDNRLPSEQFRRPTFKAGVPHIEAPQHLLESMLTARLHLDDVSEENGPLKVIPGSHRTGKVLSDVNLPPRTILATRGDVLLMRPLLAHCSGHTHPGTTRHRRILHLEFAASAELPDGYAWHEFLVGR